MASLFNCLAILALLLKSITKAIIPSFVAPSTVSTKPTEPAECAVCLLEITKGEEISNQLRCNHAFHKFCLNTWMEYKGSTCPVCRDQLSLSGKKRGIKAKADAEAEFGRKGGETTLVFSPFSEFGEEDNWWIR